MPFVIPQNSVNAAIRTANILHGIGQIRDLYLEAKERNIEFYFHQCGSMFLKDGENIGKWNLNEQIKRAEEIQHELERTYK